MSQHSIFSQNMETLQQDKSNDLFTKCILKRFHRLEILSEADTDSFAISLSVNGADIGYIEFDLEGKYETLEFDLVRRDNFKTSEDARAVYTFVKSLNNQTQRQEVPFDWPVLKSEFSELSVSEKHISVPVRNVHTLKIEGSRYSEVLAFVNITLSASSYSSN